MAVKDWSTTAASNTGILSGISLDGAVMTIAQTDNAFREMAAQIASQLGKVGFKGANMASAATTNLANATGWYVDVTGTTTITGLGTVAAGQMFMLRFAGALTLTYDATSLILPGGVSIATSAGDVAVMVSLGSGNWRCVAYTRASGDLAVGGAFTSRGIDDNATGERLQIADTDLTFGTSDTSTFNIFKPDATGALTISGGDTTSNGATIWLYGSSHPTLAGDFYITSAGADRYKWRQSLQRHEFNDEVRITSVGTGSQTKINFVNSNGIVGSIVTSGSATAYNTSSDERLKENFAPIDAGPILDALNVYCFDWKSGGSGYGVKAQEAHEIFPDAITPGKDEDDPWSADYSKFVPLLLAEVKTLRARLAVLEAR